MDSGNRYRPGLLPTSAPAPFSSKSTSDPCGSSQIKKGVKTKKLRSVGYGEYCPKEQASNEAAWKMNRRVEFKVIQVDGQLTGVDAACARARKLGIGRGSGKGVGTLFDHKP